MPPTRISTALAVVIACAVSVLLFLLGCILYIRCRRRKSDRHQRRSENALEIAEQEHELELIRLRRLAEGLAFERQGLGVAALKDPWADDEREPPPVYSKRVVGEEEVRLL